MGHYSPSSVYAMRRECEHVYETFSEEEGKVKQEIYRLQKAASNAF